MDQNEDSLLLVNGSVQVTDLIKIQTFKVPVVLAYINPGEDSDYQFDPSCEIQVINPVPVATDDKLYDVIGHASVYTDGKRLLADLFIVKDCPERLEIETRSKKLYCICGFEIIESSESTGKFVVKKCRLMRIKVSTDCPDDRLPALGEPTL